MSEHDPEQVAASYSCVTFCRSTATVCILFGVCIILYFWISGLLYTDIMDCMDCIHCLDWDACMDFLAGTECHPVGWYQSEEILFQSFTLPHLLYTGLARVCIYRGYSAEIFK